MVQWTAGKEKLDFIQCGMQAHPCYHSEVTPASRRHSTYCSVHHYFISSTCVHARLTIGTEYLVAIHKIKCKEVRGEARQAGGGGLGGGV